MVKIEIEMSPFGKARPRVTRGGSHTYMPEAYEAKRAQLKLMYQAAGGELNPERPVGLHLKFFFRMPKSWSKKRQMDTQWNHCKKTPDIDNLVGAVMDSLIEKDQYVVTIWASKYWDYRDRIEILMEEK